MLFYQPQQSYTASVGPLFNPAGGKDSIDNLTCVNSNRICSSAETVAVPFQIFLVILRHMFRNSGILTTSAIEPAAAGDSFVIIKNFNRCICYTHINLIYDILIRHGIEYLLYCDVIVELHSGLFLLGKFKGCGRQRSQ